MGKCWIAVDWGRMQMTQLFIPILMPKQMVSMKSNWPLTTKSDQQSVVNKKWDIYRNTSKMIILFLIVLENFFLISFNVADAKHQECESLPFSM